MASLLDTTINGGISGMSAIYDTSADATEWYKLSHCINQASGPSDNRGTGLPYLHVRTPWSTEASDGFGWNPWMIQVVGYHTYSGERFHDFKAVVNTTGDGNNSFYGSRIVVNTGNAASSPYVYRSANTYGGSRRLCFAIGKISCCCTGYLWVKAWKNAGRRADHPWATWFSNDNTAAYW
jgi:hypothetical protein